MMTSLYSLTFISSRCTSICARINFSNSNDSHVMACKFQDEFCINIYTGVHQQATIFINTKFLRKVNSCFFELTINWL